MSVQLQFITQDLKKQTEWLTEGWVELNELLKQDDFKKYSFIKDVEDLSGFGYYLYLEDSHFANKEWYIILNALAKVVNGWVLWYSPGSDKLTRWIFKDNKFLIQIFRPEPYPTGFCLKETIQNNKPKL